MALKQIKNKIISTQKTGKVTKAMEAVSAVKMRKSQERALSSKPYAEAAVRILHRLSTSREGKRIFRAQERTEGRDCFVVITSDKGLAGSLNSAVLKQVALAIGGRGRDDVRIIAFGKKAYEFFLRNGYTLDGQYTNISDDVSLADMVDVMKTVMDGFNRGVYRKVSIVYQNFVSTFEQNALMRQVLPLDPKVLEVMVHDIVPKAGRFSDTPNDVAEHVYTIEPSAEEVMHTLIPQLVQIMLYHALLESKASEHSARMVAMKNATDKAKERMRILTLQFNKARQTVITREVSEITGGIEALKT